MAAISTSFSNEDTYVRVVIVAGAAGMTAAITGTSHVLRVLLLEASPCVGGTSALLAGSVWVPSTLLAQEDDPEAAARYLDAVAGNRSRAEMRAAFLAQGPRMVAARQKAGALDLVRHQFHPDHMIDLRGAVDGGQALVAKVFDRRRLGRHFELLGPPLPEFSIFGGMMVDRNDITHLLNATRKPKSYLYADRLSLRQAWGRLLSPRGRRLAMGNAVAGRLLAFLLPEGVAVRTGVPISEILVENGRARGVLADGKKN